MTSRIGVRALGLIDRESGGLLPCRRVEDGIETLRAELARAVQSGRVHGAYLFEGPRGTEAAETARWFARLLLCTEPGAQPCERCRGCLRTRPAASAPDPGAPEAEGTRHPDLHAIRAEGATLRIDAVRGLQRALGLVANEGGRRVGLIWEADQLNPAGANALLKTLEEPPPGATLILVARSAAALPPTVRSRLLRVFFAPHSEEQIRLALEASGVEPDDAELAAALGGGSLGSAQRWIEENLEPARAFRRDLEALRDGPRSAILDLAEGFRGSGVREQVLLFLDVHGALTRSRLRSSLAADDPASAERCLAQLETGQRLRRELERRNLNPQLAVEALLLAPSS